MTFGSVCVGGGGGDCERVRERLCLDCFALSNSFHPGYLKWRRPSWVLQFRRHECTNQLVLFHIGVLRFQCGQPGRLLRLSF
jgi:hypothetical protein